MGSISDLAAHVVAEFDDLLTRGADLFQAAAQGLDVQGWLASNASCTITRENDPWTKIISALAADDDDDHRRVRRFAISVEAANYNYQQLRRVAAELDHEASQIIETAVAVVVRGGRTARLIRDKPAQTSAIAAYVNEKNGPELCRALVSQMDGHLQEVQQLFAETTDQNGSLARKLREIAEDYRALGRSETLSAWARQTADS